MDPMALDSSVAFFVWESSMRRLTGVYDGVEHVVLEYPGGQVECPSDLRDALQDPDGSMPTGTELEQAMRLLCGDSLQVREL